MNASAPGIGLGVPTRECFRKALAAIESARAARSTAYDALQAEYEAEGLALWKSIRRKGWPLAKPDWTKPGALEAREPLDAEYKGKAETLHAQHKAILAECEQEANRIAETLHVEPGEDWHEAERIGSWAYSSQGYGAVSYAKGACENRMLDFEAHGVETRIRKTDAKPAKGFHGVPSATFVGEARVRDALDIEIGKRKPRLSLRDWMKACWRKGLNPRVLNPFLPHGLEERMGVGYQGQDVEPAASEWAAKESE